MIATSHSTFVKTFISLLCAAALCGSVGAVRAADHGDAPNVAGDQACGSCRSLFFLDPNDNNKAVIILTVRGFIVPGEAVNFAIFDQKARFGIDVENTGDAIPDKAFIDVHLTNAPPIPVLLPRQILQVPRAQTATINCQTTGHLLRQFSIHRSAAHRRSSQSRTDRDVTRCQTFLPAKSMIRSSSTFLRLAGLSHRCAMALPIPLYLIARATLSPVTIFCQSPCGFPVSHDQRKRQHHRC